MQSALSFGCRSEISLRVRLCQSSSSNAAIFSLRYSAHPAYSKLTKLTKAELVS